MRILTTFFLISILNISVVLAKDKLPWTIDLNVGDTVCVYDIDLDDPLVDNKGRNSFKYWYRYKVGDQRPKFELRPKVINLKLKILWPGLTIFKEKGEDSQYVKPEDQWFSGSAVVIKGGQKLDFYVANKDDIIDIQKGKNAILTSSAGIEIMNNQVLHFTKARFKKSKFGRLPCRRKYKMK